MGPHLQECDWHQIDASVDPAAYAACLDRLDASPNMKLMRGSFVPPVTYGPGLRGGRFSSAFMKRADVKNKKMVRASDWLHLERPVDRVQQAAN